MQVVPNVKPRPGALDMAAIAREHYEAVFRFCARRVGVDRAADVAQETFVTAQKVLHKFRGESSLSTWLFGIAHNECRRDSRRGRTEPMLLEMDPAQPAIGVHEDALVDREVLRQAMARLSTEHREVVMLHELDGLTYEEVAGILGVPVGTVKSRLHHAFMNLRKTMFPAAEEVR
ncbi:RNA polymerase sigma factor [Fimbriimonas ginsengisoli]|uniref:RNA polymerase, sigma-24 subunit, ECF subfamily protein n=1 Tax=Fimbriimonas ginsengisoli Gsoil 348 TaxID=661478 RepID=A0A068NSS8_FIMGI|nr:RNA polymerase sigma factor [Fimbriimonas ginsengisoli]AIE86558.1 RNA polymerase, sigma-24 subunit, ECF subfamily protein [Fimbriimonas ginsengisoli Gsoil 348]